MAATRPTHCYTCGEPFTDSRHWVKNYGCNECRDAIKAYRAQTRTWFLNTEDVAHMSAREKIKRAVRVERLVQEVGA